MTDIVNECIMYSKTFDIQEFIVNFFGKEKVTRNDQYIFDKINELRYNFGDFWLSLDETSKHKFIQMVQQRKTNTRYYKVDMPNVTIINENGKRLLKII